jgi:hypothetical protein
MQEYIREYMAHLDSEAGTIDESTGLPATPALGPAGNNWDFRSLPPPPESFPRSLDRPPQRSPRVKTIPLASSQMARSLQSIAPSVSSETLTNETYVYKPPAPSTSAPRRGHSIKFVDRPLFRPSSYREQPKLEQQPMRLVRDEESHSHSQSTYTAKPLDVYY